MSEIKEKTMYECPECGQSYDEYRRAARCDYEHAKELAINADFESGLTLGNIWSLYGGMMKDLPEELKNIHKDNCFVVSYLQCCDRPAYRISHISMYGEITVSGDGSYSGGYTSKVGFHSLTDPRPLSELWKYSEQGAFGSNKK